MAGVGGVRPPGPGGLPAWQGPGPGGPGQAAPPPPQVAGARGPADAAALGGNQRAAGLQLGPGAQGPESDEAFVTRMYQELLGRKPERGGLAHHLKLLGQGMSRDQMWASVSVSAERRALLAKGEGRRPPADGVLPDPNGPQFGPNPGLQGGAQRVHDGGGGFLWKPVSDSTGKLAILFPPKFSGSLVSCELFSADGRSLGKGSDGGVGNGDRQHFRFPKPGHQYPVGTVVVGTLANGERVTYTIDRPGQRND